MAFNLIGVSTNGNRAFIQQGKRGAGKFIIASIMHQVLKHLDQEMIAFATVPVNAPVSRFKEFKTTCLEILKNGRAGSRQFDTLIDAIMEQPLE